MYLAVNEADQTFIYIAYSPFCVREAELPSSIYICPVRRTQNQSRTFRNVGTITQKPPKISADICITMREKSLL